MAEKQKTPIGTDRPRPVGKAMLPLLDTPPDGLSYWRDFLSDAEEATLLNHVEGIAFANFEMRGVIARRRVAFFGRSYSQRAAASLEPPIPTFLDAVRARIAAWAGKSPETFAMALINEYPPGAPIGWHRDAPQYEVVAGISIGAPAQMRFRPYVPPRLARTETNTSRRTVYQLTLAPRSAYLLTGDARHLFEHSIPPVTALRYSITFRTLRESYARKRS